jgi:hypothetical protein
VHVFYSACVSLIPPCCMAVSLILLLSLAVDRCSLTRTTNRWCGHQETTALQTSSSLAALSLSSMLWWPLCSSLSSGESPISTACVLTHTAVITHRSSCQLVSCVAPQLQRVHDCVANTLLFPCVSITHANNTTGPSEWLATPHALASQRAQSCTHPT